MAVVGGGQGWGSVIVRGGQQLGLDVDVIEKGTTATDRDQIIDQSDIVFFAAPDNEIPQILSDVGDRLEGISVLDCATNKGGFEEPLIALANRTSVCSTHPMVRSETPLRDQNAIIMPIGPMAQKATEVAEALFSALRMRLCRLKFEQHGDLAIVQQLPHLIQRLVIDALGTILAEKGITLGEISNVAPANFGVTELAAGRVAVQRPDVSAGIISSSLNSDLGKRILAIIFQSLENIVALAGDRNALSAYFAKSLDQLDPSESWRDEMNTKTDMHVEARANFRKCNIVVAVSNDEKGVLEKIGAAFAACDMNIAAIHSHLVESDDGTTTGVRFNIGVDEIGDNWDMLVEECQKLGWQISRTNN